MTPEQRSLRGRIGAHVLHAAGKTNTAPAREAFGARFYAGIPDELPQAERDRRAAHARTAYFAQLAYRSSRARSSRSRTQKEKP